MKVLFVFCISLLSNTNRKNVANRIESISYISFSYFSK